MGSDCWGPDISRPSDSLFVKGPVKRSESRHDDGRICIEDDGHWWIWFDERDAHEDRRRVVDGKIECVRNHGIEIDADLSERGEFGFPHPGRMLITTDMVLDGTLRIGGETIFAPVDKVDRVAEIINEARELYRRRAAGYKTADGDPSEVLGVKGQFSDINRKYWKLKGMLWDETIPIEVDKGMGESAEEVLMDFIGHAALTIDMLRRQRGQGEEGTS